MYLGWNGRGKGDRDGWGAVEEDAGAPQDQGREREKVVCDLLPR